MKASDFPEMESFQIVVHEQWRDGEDYGRYEVGTYTRLNDLMVYSARYRR